jgi:hypothetical protein
MYWCVLAVAAVAQGPVDLPFPTPPTKKGLQVQMVDDALALGIHHAGLNVSLGGLWVPAGKEAGAQVFVASDGKTYHFSTGYTQSLDRQIKPLSEGGVVVYAILLAYRTKQPACDEVLLHPAARTDHKYSIAAFNTVTDAGTTWLRAAFEYLADRYRPRPAGESAPKGTVWGWIVGNEVNSHWMWYNRGLASVDEVASDYEKAVRLCHQAVRRSSRHGRVYLSFDHHWTASMPGISAQESLPGRTLLDVFAMVARERGDFDWHVATHPYPDDLGNPRTWLDKAAPASIDAKHITFKNLEQQVIYMRRPELLFQGAERRIILSEQGFHCLKNAEGEHLQAAAYAYAWEKCRRLPTVDSFILHRHVDHAHEGGLRLGLYENQAGSVSTPGKQRPIWHLMKKAGTPEWDEAVKGYLPTVGLESWDQLPGADAPAVEEGARKP